MFGGMGYLKSRPQGHHASASVLPETTTRVASLHHVGGVGGDESDHDEKKEHASAERAVKSPRSPMGGFAQSPTPIGGKGGVGPGSKAARHAFLATLFLAILAVENTASMLARRYAVGVIHLSFSKNAVLMMNEVMKMGFSVAMVLAQPPNSRGGGRDHGGRRKHLRRVVLSSRPMAVPAVVYLIVNLISYPALERINASVFTAISQLKVLATAFFAVVMLKTPISGRKWRTLTMMVLGVTLVSWESAPDTHHHSHSDASAWDLWEMVSPEYMVGIMCAAAQTMLSGFASIYFEMVLKRRTGGVGGGGGAGDAGGKKMKATSAIAASGGGGGDSGGLGGGGSGVQSGGGGVPGGVSAAAAAAANDVEGAAQARASAGAVSVAGVGVVGRIGAPVFSVWDRNIQLAVYSIGIYLPIAWFETNGDVLQGWTPLVWGIACLHASGGILVALAVLYTSSITKTVAVCASLVLTTVLGHVLFEAPLNGPILLGCFVVVLAVFGYRVWGGGG